MASDRRTIQSLTARIDALEDRIAKLEKPAKKAPAKKAASK